MLRGKTRLLGIIFLALVIAVLTFIFFNSQRQTTKVFVAAKFLEAGAYLTDKSVEERQIHPSAALPNTPKDKSELVGQVLLLQRAPGDQITLDMVGQTGGSAYAKSLPPNYRAIAVDVTFSTGAMGVLRPGDRVDVIAVWESSLLVGGTAAAVGGGGASPLGGRGTFALPVVRDALVLALPSSFRYVEVPTGGEEEEVIPGRLSQQAQTASVRSTVLLAVPGDFQEILPPYTDTHGIYHPPFRATPIEVLAALNKTATLHLVLRPPKAAELLPSPLVLGDFSDMVLNYAVYEKEQSGGGKKGGGGK
ncbi:MAG: Flp pilus assembly protein CpaB [Thermoproteota archaeon]